MMAEVGIDLSDRKPRKLLREMQPHADWAVTMGCGDACDPRRDRVARARARRAQAHLQATHGMSAHAAPAIAFARLAAVRALLDEQAANVGSAAALQAVSAERT